MFKTKFLADRFHVRDQVRQRIVLAAALRAATAGAALIEQYRVEAFRIEQATMVGLAPAAGSAVQVDRGNAVLSADAFDVNLMTVADSGQFRSQWRKRVGA
jgi:hypothetical protein